MDTSGPLRLCKCELPQWAWLFLSLTRTGSKPIGSERTAVKIQHSGVGLLIVFPYATQSCFKLDVIPPIALLHIEQGTISIASNGGIKTACQLSGSRVAEIEMAIISEGLFKIGSREQVFTVPRTCQGSRLLMR
jgi:hypothetical protein